MRDVSASFYPLELRIGHGVDELLRKFLLQNAIVPPPDDQTRHIHQPHFLLRSESPALHETQHPLFPTIPQTMHPSHLQRIFRGKLFFIEIGHLIGTFPKGFRFQNLNPETSERRRKERHGTYPVDKSLGVEKNGASHASLSRFVFVISSFQLPFFLRESAKIFRGEFDDGGSAQTGSSDHHLAVPSHCFPKAFQSFDLGLGREGSDVVQLSVSPSQQVDAVDVDAARG
mmetsp:Transcript_24484/g.48966  ORF Transcript_24484/g.48966 Transcript_24484/m.48966 type:complete len:229 (+) Transcript_24484:579-1265(+)